MVKTYLILIKTIILFQKMTILSSLASPSEISLCNLIQKNISLKKLSLLLLWPNSSRKEELIGLFLVAWSYWAVPLSSVTICAVVNDQKWISNSGVCDFYSPDQCLYKTAYNVINVNMHPPLLHLFNPLFIIIKM